MPVGDGADVYGKRFRPAVVAGDLELSGIHVQCRDSKRKNVRLGLNHSDLFNYNKKLKNTNNEQQDVSVNLRCKPILLRKCTAYRVGDIIDTIIDTSGTVVHNVVGINIDYHVLLGIGGVVVCECRQCQQVVRAGINRDTSTGKPVEVPVVVSVEAFGNTKLRPVTLLYLDGVVNNFSESDCRWELRRQ